MDARNKETIDRIISLYLRGEFSLEAEADVRKWLAETDRQEDTDPQMWKFWNELDPVYDKHAEATLRKIKKELGFPAEKKTLPLRKVITRIAAVLIPLLAIAGIYSWLFDGADDTPQNKPLAETKVSVTDGLPRQTMAFNGTEIWVNKKSKLTSRLDDNVANLRGEAYFDVAKQKERPMVIQTQYITINVLGTQFNVRENPDSDITTVSLYTGQLDIYTPVGKIHLEAGHELLYYHIGYNEIRTTAKTRPDWMRDIINFDQVSLEDIIHELEIIYDVRFSYNKYALNDNPLTFKFEESTDINTVMFLLSELSGKITYRVEKGTVYITPIAPKP